MGLTELLEEYKPLGEVKGQGTLELYGTLLPRDRLRLNTGSTLPTIGTYSDFRPGRAPFSIEENVGGFPYQYRAGPHERYGKDHINIETLSPLSDTEKLRRILDNLHIRW